MNQNWKKKKQEKAVPQCCDYIFLSVDFPEGKFQDFFHENKMLRLLRIFTVNKMSLLFFSPFLLFFTNFHFYFSAFFPAKIFSFLFFFLLFSLSFDYLYHRFFYQSTLTPLLTPVKKCLYAILKYTITIVVTRKYVSTNKLLNKRVNFL